MAIKRPVVTTATMITPECMRDNIAEMLMRDVRLARLGFSWYRRANRAVRRISRATGYDRYLVASVIAVISPSVDWRDNVPMAIALLRNPDATTFRNSHGNTSLMLGYPANIAKARAIIRTGDTSLCRGQKVTAFRDTLLGLRSPAVIDVHATNVAMGTENVFAGPDKFYSVIAQAYADVALVFGQTVEDVQAATWIIYKATKARRA